MDSKSPVLLPDIGLLELANQTMEFLVFLQRTFETNDPDPEEKNIVIEFKRTIEDKYKRFMLDQDRARPASSESLEELHRLRKQVEEKNEILDSLLSGLKALELDISVRNGAAAKQNVLREKAKERRVQETRSVHNSPVQDVKRFAEDTNAAD